MKWGILMIQIAIVDDETLFGEYLEKLVTKYLVKREEHFEICRFSSGQAFIKEGSSMMKYKIVFLDINMEELDGIETAKKLRELCENTFIIFVTAFLNSALEGYKVDAIRYLLKNADNFEESLYESLDAVFYKMSIVPKCKRYKFLEGDKQLSLDHLVYISSCLHYIIFHILGEEMGKYTLRNTLNHIEKELGEKTFLRVHQSYLVNLAFVSHIRKKMIVLVDGTELPIAKSRYKKVLESVTDYKGVL